MIDLSRLSLGVCGERYVVNGVAFSDRQAALERFRTVLPSSGVGQTDKR